MIHEPRHTITKALPRKGCMLDVSFADGFEATVDLSQMANRVKALKKLGDAETFALARPADHGGFVIWIEDELELAGDNLRNLAVEQTGGIGHERMVEWMHRNRLKQQEAADAIGISRRMLNYYISGAKPIPRTVWLACRGFDLDRNASQAVHHDSGQDQLEVRRSLALIEQWMEQSNAAMDLHLREVTERIEEQFLRVDAAMDEELCNAMNTFGQQLAALSEKFVEDYTPLTERLREVVNLTRAN